MKREDVKSIFAPVNPTDEMIDSVMKKHGEIANGLKAENESLKKQLEERDKDIEALKKSSGDYEAVTKQLSELQTKYEEQAKAHAADIAKRDYADAVRTEIAEAGIKFSCEAAKRDYMSQLTEKGLKLENGRLTGFSDFHKTYLEANEGAILAKPENTGTAAQSLQGVPSVRFSTPAGTGQQQVMSAADMAAARFNKMYSAAKEINSKGAV